MPRLHMIYGSKHSALQRTSPAKMSPLSALVDKLPSNQVAAINSLCALLGYQSLEGDIHQRLVPESRILTLIPGTDKPRIHLVKNGVVQEEAPWTPRDDAAYHQWDSMRLALDKGLSASHVSTLETGSMMDIDTTINIADVLPAQETFSPFSPPSPSPRQAHASLATEALLAASVPGERTQDRSGSPGSEDNMAEIEATGIPAAGEGTQRVSSVASSAPYPSGPPWREGRPNVFLPSPSSPQQVEEHDEDMPDPTPLPRARFSWLELLSSKEHTAKSFLTKEQWQAAFDRFMTRPDLARRFKAPSVSVGHQHLIWSWLTPYTVSYTHLTLPTIYSV